MPAKLEEAASIIARIAACNEGRTRRRPKGGSIASQPSMLRYGGEPLSSVHEQVRSQGIFKAWQGGITSLNHATYAKMENTNHWLLFTSRASYSRYRIETLHSGLRREEGGTKLSTCTRINPRISSYNLMRPSPRERLLAS
ncbi:expressed unknown protein [Seminavis robusta]|uniref:Uncharacterized protein n=1 Tax=Seminavis robusta TaxID=568900 RepID=A0A9N8F163_9STRA|nr:expressed unknown protein [Seminavis robusta]|eukprot:Sro2470_g328611.1  (141) ;mRNA; f:11260-11682